MRRLSRGPGRPRKNFALPIDGQKRAYTIVDSKVRSEKQERVYQLRKAIGVTRPELGKMIGVSAQTIYDWEHGHKEPNRLAWNAFRAVWLSYRRKFWRMGKEWDGGPVMRAFDR